MNRILRALVFAAASISTIALITTPASAQNYPSKAIHIVVPFAPGGPADAVGRVLSRSFSDTWGQAVVVDNRAGAAGNLGVSLIAKAAPDGYTIGIVPLGNIAVNPALFPDLPYKAADLVPVAMIATVENVLVVNPNVPARSLKELLALATRQPESLSFASPGAGSQAHLAGELMSLEGNVHLIHVPYKGTGPALTDLLGGQVTMMFGQMSSVLPLVKSGKLRAIGVASLKRSPDMPDVPTIAEQGLPGFEAVSWYALMAPAGTPRAVIDQLNAQCARLLGTPALKEEFAKQGLQPGGGTPAELAATIRAESTRWADVIVKKNIKPE